MAEPDKRPAPPGVAPSTSDTCGGPSSGTRSSRAVPGDDKVLCERCGVEMFRMHAVWRCPRCRFKTDCCGWS